MARHYSTKDFFRQMPNLLLARFFQEQELLLEFDFAAMKEGKPNTLFLAGCQVWKTFQSTDRVSGWFVIPQTPDTLP